MNGRVLVRTAGALAIAVFVNWAALALPVLPFGSTIFTGLLTLAMPITVLALAGTAAGVLAIATKQFPRHAIEGFFICFARRIHCVPCEPARSPAR